MYSIYCAIISCFLPISQLPAPLDCASCSTIVRQMAWSLENEPAAWTTDGYRVTRFDAAIWIANCAYDVEIGPDDRHTGKLQNPEEAHLLCNKYYAWITKSERFK